MGDPVDRMRVVISTLNEFYARRFHEVEDVLGRIEKETPAEFADEDHTPYAPYLQALNQGLGPVLSALQVQLDPIPPDGTFAAKEEILLSGVRMLTWTLTVRDGRTSAYVGKVMWGFPHRHDRAAVPGPVKVTFYKAAQGRTVMVG